MALLGFANTMLLTRLLSQQVYAMYGLMVTFVTAADMFVALGYDQAYMRFYYTHDRKPIGFLWECLKVPLVVFTVFAIVLLEPGQHLITYIFEDRLGFAVVLGVLGQVFFSSIHRFTQLTARMGECAVNYVLSNIVSKSGFIVILLLLSLVVQDIAFGWVVTSFVIMSAASSAINLVVFRKVGKKQNSEGRPITNKEMLQYGFPYMINNVIVLLIPVLEKVIIRDLAGWEVLSIFTAASVFQTVVGMVTMTLNNIWNPVVYKNCENEAVFKSILHTFGMVGAMIMSLGTAACILLRRWLVLLLDAKYFSVYMIAPVILLAACFNILCAIYSVGINIRKKTVHFVVAPILQIIASVALCYLLIPSLGLIGVGIAVLVSIGISRFYQIIMGLHSYNTGCVEVKTFLLCGLCVVAAVTSMFFTTLKDDLILSLLLLAASFVIMNRDILVIIRSVLAVVKTSNKKQ